MSSTQELLYKAALEDEQILKALEAIQKEAEELGKEGDAAFKKIGAAAEKEAKRIQKTQPALTQQIKLIQKTGQEQEKAAAKAAKAQEKAAIAQEKAAARVTAAQIKATRQQIAEHQKVLKLTKLLNKELEDSGKKSFQGLGEASRLSGLQIGLISGVVSSLTTELLNFGKQGADAILSLVTSSAQVASQLEVTGKVFTGIFQGNEEAATAALARIRKESRLLGVDLGEVAASFLPFVESLDQLTQVSKVAAALAISQPDQGAVGARIALQEALSGNVSSLVKRFELPKEFAKKLQDALDTGGVGAFLAEFEGVLKTLGRDLDTLADTFQASLGKVEQQGQRLQAAFGAPVIEEAKEQLDAIFQVIEERGGDFEFIAQLLGDMVAQVVEFVGSGFVQALQDVDPKTFEDLYNAVLGLFDAISAVAEVIFGIPDDVSLVNGPLQVVVELVEFAGKAMRAFAAAVGLAQAGFEGLTETFPAIIGHVRLLSGAAKVMSGNFGAGSAEIAAALESIEKGELFDPLAGAKATKDRVKEVLAILDDLDAGAEERAKRINEIFAGIGKEGSETEANNQLAEQQRERELTELLEAGAEARAKIAEKEQEIERDHAEKLLDIRIKAEQDYLDQLEKNAQKRFDLAVDNARKIADIQTKNEQDITDASTDLRRNEEDIIRNNARKRTEIEQDQANARIETEREYQKQIADIRNRFQQSALDAERNRDAVAFLEAVRQRNQEIQEAKTGRDEKIANARTEAEQKRQTLNEQLQFELEDARIANQRKLEDLALNLERQLEQQRLANERALQDQLLAEQRAEQEQQLSLERQNQAAELANQRKKEDLARSLAAEIELVKQAEKAKLEEMKRTASEAARLRQQLDQARQASDFEASRHSRGLERRADGGPVSAGQPYLVGERGPELFSPRQSGIITPNNRLISSLPSASRISNTTINNGGNVTAPMTLINPGEVEAIAAAIAQKKILETLSKVRRS